MLARVYKRRNPSTWDNPGSLKKHFGKYYSTSQKCSKFDHRLSFICSGFRDMTHEEATVVVIDAIGEWDNHNMGR